MNINKKDIDPLTNSLLFLYSQQQQQQQQPTNLFYAKTNSTDLNGQLWEFKTKCKD